MNTHNNFVEVIACNGIYIFLSLKCYLSSTVKNLTFHPTFKLTKIACHSFVDTGRRHENPKSERKDFIIQGIAHNKSFTFISLPFAPKL